MNSKEKLNLTSPSQVRSLLIEMGIHPCKALGQNFLVDLNILNILIESANLSQTDRVLEIGPGLGVVTEQLLTKVDHVTAVEKDKRLFQLLKARMERHDGLELMCADMLDVGAGILASSRLNKVVSNLPYSVGSRILVELAISDVRPQQIVVTVQEEVAGRLVARPGGKAYGALTVWIQACYDVSVVKTVSPTCFWPRPEVRSAIVNMVRHDRYAMNAGTRRFFYDLTKHMFTYRRKQLSTTLGKASGLFGGKMDPFVVLGELGIDPKARPENLSVEDWRRLAVRGQC
jgi:16S rRNA (adenine1518-N6/adenine1519-N6)-dimethyltransferase